MKNRFIAVEYGENGSRKDGWASLYVANINEAGVLFIRLEECGSLVKMYAPGFWKSVKVTE